MPGGYAAARLTPGQTLDGKYEILVEGERPLDEWLPELEQRLGVLLDRACESYFVRERGAVICGEDRTKRDGTLGGERNSSFAVSLDQQIAGRSQENSIQSTAHFSFGSAPRQSDCHGLGQLSNIFRRHRAGQERPDSQVNRRRAT